LVWPSLLRKPSRGLRRFSQRPWSTSNASASSTANAKLLQTVESLWPQGRNTPKSRSTKPPVPIISLFNLIAFPFAVGDSLYIYLALIDDPLQTFYDLFFWLRFSIPFFFFLVYALTTPFFAFDDLSPSRCLKLMHKCISMIFPFINLCGTCTSCILQHVIITYGGSPSSAFFIL
jgi:hypothetical protein